MSEPDAGGVGAEVSLSVAIGSLTEEMRAERDRKLWLSQDVAYVEAPAIVLPPALGSTPGWGPNTSYAWAVQRMTLAGLGATSDLVTVYRGNSPLSPPPPQNALYSFSIAAAGAVATWHPGRTGLILMPEESIMFAGTFTGSGLIVSVDLIQLHMSKIPYFLL